MNEFSGYKKKVLSKSQYSWKSTDGTDICLQTIVPPFLPYVLLPGEVISVRVQGQHGFVQGWSERSEPGAIEKQHV